ncbi:AMP-binding protein [Streptomyces sp. NPDC088387]|uniref:AMP-binding protein n=1 Tax=Streptomyces sp. NPDC088387 TaxID=3365859 RepID=UPI00380C97D9
MSPLPLIHEAVAVRAAGRPDALAVVHGQERVTYGQLEAAADAYATVLRKYGVTHGSYVPVALPRSAQLIAVLLSVLKCGAAYAAVDQRWPRARVLELLDALRPPVLVARSPAPGDASGATVPTWAPASPDLEVTPPAGPPLPGNDVTGADPATVFFTSGTSGRSRAVVSPHRATTRLFAEPTDWWGPGQVVLQAAPVAWDAFSLEVWGTLATGGTCVLAGTDHPMPARLRALVRESGVDTAFLTTALFHLFVEEDIDCFAGMRSLLTGGERLSPALARRFLDRHPGIRLTNCYGPVESCVFSSTHRIEPRDCEGGTGVPLGRPVPGTEIHVLDGEICVAGDGLAIGYLGDPLLTAERFTTVPVEGRPRHVYHTGDLGFLDADGVLHFRGRRDRQVKVSGHRVEPEEIEAVCRRIGGVRDCAVVAVPREDGGGVRLALFYALGSGVDDRELSAADVRRELRARLPRYLLPHTVQRLDAFPLTANGKVSHSALSELSARVRTPSETPATSPAAPRSP